jgi:hypothetical protein
MTDPSIICSSFTLPLGSYVLSFLSVHSLFIFFNVVPSRMTYWTGVIWSLPRLFPLHLPYHLQSSRTVPS